MNTQGSCSLSPMNKGRDLFACCKAGSLAIIVAVLLLLSACRASRSATDMGHEAPTSLPATPPLEPEGQPKPAGPAATEAMIPTQTPSVRQRLDRVLAFAYFPPERERLSDIWLLPPPYERPRPLRQHDETYAYCCPVCSPDGDWLAYVRTRIADSVSSLWVVKPDGSGARQVGPEMERGPMRPGVPAIYPFGWSPDGARIYLFLGDEILAAGVLTGEVETLELHSGEFVEYNQTSGNVVLQQVDIVYGEPLVDGAPPVIDRELYTYRLVNLAHPDRVVDLPAPSPYSPVGGGGLPFRRSEVSLSPGGRYLAIAGYDRKLVQERLWIVDVASKSWTLAISRDIEWIPDAITWSPRQDQMSWWTVSKDTRANYYLLIYFVDTSTWEITDKFSSETPKMVPAALGWVPGLSGECYFGVLVPQDGILLLRPSDDTPLRLIEYNELAGQLPFSPDDAQDWTWQP